MSIRVLHVEDEPFMRKLVHLSLAQDAEMIVAQCESGIQGLRKAIEWLPDLILSDVLMSEMAGPEMLSRLLLNPTTSNIPVVFMTSQAQALQCDQLVMLGAKGVISKPFEPKRLRHLVRAYIAPSASERESHNVPVQEHLATISLSGEFADRLRADEAALVAFRLKLREGKEPAWSGEMQACVHKLAGAAGIFGFVAVSQSASALENSIIDICSEHGALEVIERNLDALICVLAESK